MLRKEREREGLLQRGSPHESEYCAKRGNALVWRLTPMPMLKPHMLKPSTLKVKLFKPRAPTLNAQTQTLNPMPMLKSLTLYPKLTRARMHHIHQVSHRGFGIRV